MNIIKNLNPSLTLIWQKIILDIEKSSFFIIFYLRTIVECVIINV